MWSLFVRVLWHDACISSAQLSMRDVQCSVRVACTGNVATWLLLQMQRMNWNGKLPRDIWIELWSGAAYATIEQTGCQFSFVNLNCNRCTGVGQFIEALIIRASNNMDAKWFVVGPTKMEHSKSDQNANTDIFVCSGSRMQTFEGWRCLINAPSMHPRPWSVDKKKWRWSGEVSNCRYRQLKSCTFIFRRSALCVLGICIETYGSHAIRWCAPLALPSSS